VPEPKIELYCHVRGEDAYLAILVRMKLSESVYDLKKAIQQERKNEFEAIDANQLVLWKTSIPIDDNFDQAIHDATFTYEGQLRPVTLSDVFPVPPPQGHIHIVVQGQRSSFLP
jgi:hypothetical protein